ncbi:hypothetical protein F2Q68_00032053 [Brassica cretica]|uniref:Uncharacterized protein n=1 Tax=Brassica cretica TaxID=69181 RepID=A0A8S9GFB8_BRACR|nr:hypothetical protein F2Q68_00032053 [Brassica cretica]
MANSFTLLGDLKAGRCSTTAKSMLMQGSVNANRLSICRERFTKGSVYMMSGFDETRNFRLSDAPSPYVSLMALFLKVARQYNDVGLSTLGMATANIVTGILTNSSGFSV